MSSSGHPQTLVASHPGNEESGGAGRPADRLRGAPLRRSVICLALERDTEGAGVLGCHA